MSKVKLREVVSFAQKRISISELNIEDYISTDNLLQNKLGVEKISNLPKSINNTPKYEPGNILVSNIRPYLKKIYYAKGQGGASSDVLIFVVKEKFDSKFVYYNLFQDSFFEHMMVGAKGTKMPRGDKNQILEYEIPYFDLPTQQKIAAVLSALDDKIELNNKINAELEAMAKTLYDYWFVQFEFPNAEGKPYKSSGGKMVYNETLKREIPEGWEVKRVEDVLDKNPTRPKINTKEYFSVGKYPIIDQSIELIAGYTNIDEYIISITIENPAIIFGDHTRILKLINFDFARGADGTQLLFSKESRMPQYLFYFTLLKIELVNYGYARHFKFLKDTPILIPTIEIGKNFNDYCKRIFEKKQNNLKQNQELAALRDWLLPMLMNGQVRVE